MLHEGTESVECLLLNSSTFRCGSTSAVITGRERPLVDGLHFDTCGLSEIKLKPSENAYGEDANGKSPQSENVKGISETSRFRVFTREQIRERGEPASNAGAHPSPTRHRAQGQAQPQGFGMNAPSTH
ncbi:hypothetical protein FQZ97_1121740 [compost metagenome]